ncbi:class I adenylate-forming enzyme family protein [Cryobacterium sp. SO1]|uniref:class I adenylate-forming enzyme family protein n=1 Tax=Cryobacterium sp. SO1 TaxID=1897061 RepID=UPI001023B8D2|nr:AMP-binding protein [Cryobacterium sp. SO1]RZI34732.1 putative acyl--CoA ligase YhfT [Cryobacterium sp. SO1]
MPILTALQHGAETHPLQLAVQVGDDRLSYVQLRDAVLERLGGNPTGTALRTGPTLISQPNGLEFVLQLLAGIAGTGSVAVLDPAWPQEQQLEVRGRLGRLELTPGAPGTPPPTGALVDGPPESTFLYGFTSGTTALPKAISRTRRSWQHSFRRSTEMFGLTGHDRTLAPGPLSASLNLYALAESLHVGAAFHTLPGFDVAAALASIENHDITRLVAVPAVLRLLAQRGLTANHSCPGISCIVSGGAKLDLDTTRLLQRWAPSATLVAFFGAAELGFVSATVLAPGQAPQSDETAVGLPFPGVHIRIVDRDNAPVSAGVPGTIQVASDLVCDGYLWGDDGAAFQQHGDWCTVGDQGFLDTAGVLHHLGRGHDMIVSAGSNVYPQEVEAALQALPGVRAAVVTGLPDPGRGLRLVAAVLADTDLDVAGLRGASSAVLASPKRPHDYYRLQELPLTAAGKVSRTILRRWIEQGDSRVIRLH